MVHWFLHLAPGFGLWLSLPTWPSRWAVLLTPRPQGGLLVKRCREGGVQPASESQIGCGDPEAGGRRSRPGGGRGGWGPAQSPGRSHCFPARSRGGSGGCDWDPRLAGPDRAGSSDPGSIPFGRSSHLARAPITDCELGVVRGCCPPAAISVPLTRISEQVPRSLGRWGCRGGQEDGGRRSWGQRSEVREGTGRVPARCVPGWWRGSAELGCLEGGGDRGRAPSVHCWAQRLGASFHQASLSRVPWIGERERGLSEARTVQRVETLVP